LAWINDRWFVDSIYPDAPSEIAQVFHNQQNPSGSATAGSLIQFLPFLKGKIKTGENK
jgi:hypothetical protein